MFTETALKIILIISVAGILFSGYLTYKELKCKTSCQKIFKLPVCVYGLVMYLIVFLISVLGLLK